MRHGLLKGLLRPHEREIGPSEPHMDGACETGFLNENDLNAHMLRDIGMREGRISPSTVERFNRSESWVLIDQPPRWL